MLNKLRLRLRALFLKSRMEDELQTELQFHLEREIEENIVRGMTPEEARYAATRKFGGVERVKEESRDARGVRLLEEFWIDLRYSARTLSKKPGFTITVLMTLALGIGANTAIFSIVNAVLFRPLPYLDDDRLVMMWGKFPRAGIKQLFVSVPEYLDYQNQNHSFTQVGIYGDKDFTLTGRGEAERFIGALVSANLHSLLGVKPLLGRHFLTEENEPDRSHVVILSHDLWQRRFGGDAQIIGHEITLNGANCAVVGVMPPGFHFPDVETEIWQPLDITPARLNERYSRWLASIARLKPDLTLAQAQADVDALARSMQREHPEFYGDEKSGWGIRVVTLRDELAGEVRHALPILLAVVSCVLLIACANVANLLLARAIGRQREIAVRAALGAGRGRIIRHLLSESLLLSLTGGALAVLLALWGNDQLVKLGPKGLTSGGPIGIDSRVLIFTLLVSLLTAVLFGLTPAWRATKFDLNDVLKESGRSVSTGRGRLRNILVIGEIAIALALLVGAGLVLRSFAHLLRIDPGFKPANLLTMQLALSPVDYAEGQQQRAFYEQALSRIEALPGVEAAGAVHNLPMSGSGNTRNFSIEGLPEIRLNVDFYQASPHYFSAMGMQAVSGRFFTPDDREDRPRVAIVNETLVRHFFRDQEPLGKRIKMGGATGPFQWLSIVGVVRDVKQKELDEETKPALYVSYLQPPLPGWIFQSMFLTVRTKSDPVSLFPSIRNTVQALDKNQPLYRVVTMEQLLARSLAARKFSMLLMALFAAVALSLSAIGLYSVMAYMVTQRTHEIGLRMALGAQTSDVVRLVVKQGMNLTFIGVALGLIASLVLTRLIKTLLFGVSAADPVTYIVIVSLLMIVALLACLIPARRAARVDPLAALRFD